MTSQTITFDPRWSIEQRKMAINKAMENHQPFSITKVELALPGMDAQDYTGGHTQMVLAEKCTLQFIRL